MNGLGSFNTDYQEVAASATKTVLAGQKGAGAIGDILAKLVIVPATTSPGKVSIFDSSGGTEIPIFTGGATSVADLKSFEVILGIRSVAGPWCVTTGANVSAIANGRFQ